MKVVVKERKYTKSMTKGASRAQGACSTLAVTQPGVRQGAFSHEACQAEPLPLPVVVWSRKITHRCLTGS